MTFVKGTNIVSPVEDSSDELSMSHSHDIEIPTLIDQGEIVKGIELVSSVENSSDELSIAHSHDARDSKSN